MSIIDPTASMACLVSFGIIVAAFNILTLIILLTNHVQRKQVQVYPLVSHLLANILIGVFALPTYGLKKLSFDSAVLQGVVCDTWRYMYFVSIHLSMFGLIIMTADKVLALRYPLHHIRIVTKPRMIIANVLCWVVVIAFDSIPFFPIGKLDSEQCHYVPDKTWAILMNVFTMCLPLPFILVCYIYIIKLAVFHARRAAKQVPAKTGRRASRVQLAVQVQATRKVLCIVGSYLLFWGLSTVYYLVTWLCPRCFPENFEPHDTWLRFFAKLLVMSHAFVSALMLFWDSAFFRKEASKLAARFCCKIGKQPAFEGTSIQSVRKQNRAHSLTSTYQTTLSAKDSFSQEKNSRTTKEQRSFDQSISESQPYDEEGTIKKCEQDCAFEGYSFQNCAVEMKELTPTTSHVADTSLKSNELSSTTFENRGNLMLANCEENETNAQLFTDYIIQVAKRQLTFETINKDLNDNIIAGTLPENDNGLAEKVI